MNRSEPQIIATLSGRTPERCREQIREARRAGADLAEIRFDLWEAALLGRIRELFPAPIPLVATYRSRSEGGEGSDDPAVRAAVLERLASAPFHLIDLEIARDGAGPRRSPNGPRFVRSAHVGQNARSRELEALLDHGLPGTEFTKLVVPSTVSEALGPLLELAEARSDRPRVLVTTGASGALFRALAPRLGFPGVYARLPESADPGPVEPSQLPVDALRWYLDGQSPGPLFALLGHPISHSRSPGIFGSWMRSLGDRGLYLALDIATAEE
ncbi:MAG TPA: type I 3-dehydroquinate dehydratase, partial [Thermoplasmata archaeon]|nr:type I 3-dehydroquinate dehydratase [Thermoplasmata archaeon]